MNLEIFILIFFGKLFNLPENIKKKGMNLFYFIFKFRMQYFLVN